MSTRPESRSQISDAPIDAIVDLVASATFRLDLDHITQESETTVAERIAAYDIGEAQRAKDNITFIKSLLSLALGGNVYDHRPTEQLGRAFDSPAQWLQYRRHIAYIAPDPKAAHNYGLLPRLTLRDEYVVDAKHRRPLGALILGQRPILRNGIVAYHTLGLIDKGSAVVPHPNGDNMYFTKIKRRKEVLNLERNYGHLVFFDTFNAVDDDIIVPDTREIESSYDKATKTLHYRPEVSVDFARLYPVSDIQKLASITDVDINDFDIIPTIVALAVTNKDDNLTEINKMIAEHRKSARQLHS